MISAARRLFMFFLLSLIAVSGLAAEQPGPATSETSASEDHTAAMLVEAVSLMDEQLRALREQVAALSSSSAEQVEEQVPALGLDNQLREADALTTEIQKTKEWYRFLEIILVSVIGVVSLGIILHFLLKTRAAAGGDGEALPREIMNASGLTLIIFGTILVVMIADVEQQLTASVGILGALAGYLFRGLHDQPEAKKRQGDLAAVGEGVKGG
jgi:hypothetical protein